MTTFFLGNGNRPLDCDYSESLLEEIPCTDTRNEITHYIPKIQWMDELLGKVANKWVGQVQKSINTMDRIGSVGTQISNENNRCTGINRSWAHFYRN